MMEQIFIENLKVFGHHGVFQQEKINGQEFIIHAQIDLRESIASTSDDLADTLNYGEVCYFIRDFFAENQFDLLEKVVDLLIQELMNHFSMIQGISLQVGKPQAPIEMEFDNIGIRGHRQWTRCYLSFGSNMGDRYKYLEDAIAKLGDNTGIRRVRSSSVMETKPYGGVKQDDFLNMAVELETYWSCYELLQLIHTIEEEANRTREIHWGPRTLDLDILFYGNLVINEADLCVPHIDLANRLFVLEPMCQLNPGLVHPVYHATMKDLLEALQQKTIEKDT